MDFNANSSSFTHLNCFLVTIWSHDLKASAIVQGLFICIVPVRLSNTPYFLLIVLETTQTW